MAYDFAARWTVDTDLSYQFSSSTKISCGGINIFNNLPNEWDGLEGVAYGSNGIKTYSRYSPFGYSGAYYYAKVGVTF